MNDVRVANYVWKYVWANSVCGENLSPKPSKPILHTSMAKAAPKTLRIRVEKPSLHDAEEPLWINATRQGSGREQPVMTSALSCAPIEACWNGMSAMSVRILP